jgi:hypothetical protein
VHLQARFEQAGYHTALLGVCHEVREPQKLGFSEYLRPTREHPEQARAMTLAASAEQFLAGRRDGAEPFYLQLGFFEPHREPGHPTHWPATHRPARRQVTVPPYLVDDAGAREELAYFEASVRTVDDAMGRILAALDENGLADDTLVIFTADHGIPFPRAKCSLYDPGLEVTHLMRWPLGGIAGGKVFDPMISNVDYLPTLCDVIGIDTPANVQGRSFAALLRGQPYKEHDAVFAELTYHQYCDPCRCIRTRTHKLIVHLSMSLSIMDPSQAWQRKTTTRVPEDPACAFHRPVELYDLAADPFEQHDLAYDPARDAVRRDLLGRLHRWMIETADPLLTEIPLPPMHRMAMHALTTGNVPDRLEDVHP